MRITKEIQGADVYNNGFDTGFQMVDGDGSPPGDVLEQISVLAEEVLPVGG